MKIGSNPAKCTQRDYEKIPSLPGKPPENNAVLLGMGHEPRNAHPCITPYNTQVFPTDSFTLLIPNSLRGHGCFQK